jgi:cyanate permease
MGPRATRFALVFWMALAVVVIILAIKPWAGARDSQSKSAAPIPARDIIYQPQHWKVF